MESSPKTPHRGKRRTPRDKLAILEATRDWPPGRVAAVHGVSCSTVLSWRANEDRFRHQEQQSSSIASIHNKNHGLNRPVQHRVPVEAPMGIASTGTQHNAQNPSRDYWQQEGHELNEHLTVNSATTSNDNVAVPTDLPEARTTATPDISLSNEVTNQLVQSVRSGATQVIEVGYVGRQGTLAEIAMRTMFPHLQIGRSRSATASIEGFGFAHAAEAMEALVDKKINYFVIPTASLLTLYPTFALEEFISRPLSIVGEITVTTDLCLCALPGTTMRECDCIMSDTALLHKFEALILKIENERGSPIVRQAAWDSAGACFIVRDQAAHGIAVLASKDAAREAGLDVLAEDICLEREEIMQYLILGRHQCEQIQPRSNCVRKATLYLSLLDQPMWLSNVMNALADAHAHVIDIQTRSSQLSEHQVLITFVATVPSPFARIPRLLLDRLGDLAVSMQVFDMYFSLASVP